MKLLTALVTPEVSLVTVGLVGVGAAGGAFQVQGHARDDVADRIAGALTLVPSTVITASWAAWI